MALAQSEAYRFDSVLVVDDEAGILDSLALILRTDGYEVFKASNGREALQFLGNHSVDLVISDIQMPEMNGLELLQALMKREFPGIVLMMSAYATLDTAIEAIKQGAFDYLAKPFRIDEIILTIRKAEERERLVRENRRLKERLSSEFGTDAIISRSQQMQSVFEVIRKVARYQTSVLISGESGTGKELIARAIHNNSDRASKPFVAINCGAIPETLLESELFGHTRGAFTDATRDKRGLLEEASGGTLFLDEIGEMPLSLQVKLLRVLQEGEIRPVGSNQVIKINVRVIAATLRDIEKDVASGLFRDDLYYRLNVVQIVVPPLRERRDDIPPLVQHFIEKHSERLGVDILGISEPAMDILFRYSWPGNVRELENCVERAIILSRGDRIHTSSLPAALVGEAQDSSVTFIPDNEFSIKDVTRRIEKELISKALNRTGGNKTHAAKLLEISHRTLLYKIKELFPELGE
ncbi:MAG: sigma-54 dependent transcriptional regulator [bacterium]|nr:sigma-54 dependent transcriptional regulator [bacterium]